jgi:hypothetical protein
VQTKHHSSSAELPNPNREHEAGTWNPEAGRRAALLAAGAFAFVILATANAAGYRYGASDQAFYIPAFVHAIEPSSFPRDRALIDAQARLMVLDEVVGTVVRATGLPLQALCAVGYVGSLLLIWGALLRIGRSLYVSGWTVVALAAACTLRHQIARTSTNTFEPYFHPRVLAFALGALAVAALLRRNAVAAIVCVGFAALVHITTAAWFGILVGVALAVAHRGFRPFIIGSGVLAGLAAAWAVTVGPLAGALVRLDLEWRALLQTKDTLFAHEWPIGAWVVNMGTAAVWAWAYSERRRRGAATDIDTGLLAGGAALLALFFITLPMSAAGVWLFVELQISRVFWLLDFMAIVYALSAVELRWAIPRVMQAVCGTLLLFSVVRGTYILLVEHPERPLFAFDVPASPWKDAMDWLARTPLETHVLADPGHAWKYGTSVRVSAGRDVFHEEVKDTAVAIYSRAVAERVITRMRVLGPFDQLTADAARRLAAEYDLDYLVAGHSLDLPVAYRNARFTIYRLE